MAKTSLATLLRYCTHIFMAYNIRYTLRYNNKRRMYICLNGRGVRRSVGFLYVGGISITLIVWRTLLFFPFVVFVVTVHSSGIRVNEPGGDRLPQPGTTPCHQSGKFGHVQVALAYFYLSVLVVQWGGKRLT